MNACCSGSISKNGGTVPECIQNSSSGALGIQMYPVSCPDHFDHPVDSPFSAPGDHSQRYHCLQCTELHRPRRKHGSCSSSHQSGGELGQAAPWPPKIGQSAVYIRRRCALPRILPGFTFGSMYPGSMGRYQVEGRHVASTQNTSFGRP